MRPIASKIVCLLTTAAIFATLAPAGAAALDPPSVGVAPVLVEIQPNPEGADSGAEWFELANPARVDLALDGWAVTDGDACFASGSGYVRNYAYALDGLVVPAGGRLVVALPDAGGCLRLGNAGDDLSLIAPGGAVAQAIAWGEGQPTAAPKEGFSVAACTLTDVVHGAWGIQPSTPGGENARCVA